MSLVLVDLPELSAQDQKHIANNANRIAKEQRVSPGDYVLGLHLGKENIGKFTALVNALRCRAVVVEPDYRSMVLLEKNLWLNTFDDSAFVYCPEAGAPMPDTDRENYAWTNVVIPGMCHNEFERAKFHRKGKLREDEYGFRCHTLNDVVRGRNIVATVLGDTYAELAIREKASRLGDIVPTDTALTKAGLRPDFESTAFVDATWVL